MEKHNPGACLVKSIVTVGYGHCEQTGVLGNCFGTLKEWLERPVKENIGDMQTLHKVCNKYTVPFM